MVASSYFFAPFRHPSAFVSPDSRAPAFTDRFAAVRRSVLSDLPRSSISLNCPLAFRFANAWFRPVPIRSEAEDWLRDQRFYLFSDFAVLPSSITVTASLP